jgi:ribonucleoside-diphosphate reductase alpha chain
MGLQDLKNNGQAPEWLTEDGYKTLSGGYLLEDETPRDMWMRVSKAAASYYPEIPDIKDRFFEILWNGWLGLATPVASNMGTNRGLPVSCFSSYMPDSLPKIFDTIKEVAMMTKHGGGTAVHMGDVRPSNALVKGTGGNASGPVSWAKILDSTILGVSQGSVRRGAVAAYLPIEHYDASAFINIRNPTQDRNFHCPNLHHGVTVSNTFMEEMLNGNSSKRDLWVQLLETRFKTGEPYIFFTDHAQKDNPKHLPWYNVKGSNLCTEIFLHTDDEHSLVCVLSSMNLAKYDEWKDTDAVKYAIYLLDAVVEEFLQKSKKIEGLERAYNFARKSRALGLGVLGYHTLLQSKLYPWDSFEAMTLNAEIFRTMRAKAEQASKELAELKGEPEWMKGTGRRNSHLLAVAPTGSNSIISGGVSPGIEPIAANVFVHKTAKGTFIKKNEILEKWLAKNGLNTDDVWKKIMQNDGSVMGIKEIPKGIQEVFLSAREINQYALVKHAAQRQKWIDQGQSLNLFFVANADPKYVHGVHVEAWKSGLKSLYYLRSAAYGKSDLASRSPDECKACEA